MATVEQIARAALGDLAVAEGNLLNAARWVNDRYTEFAGTIRLRGLRRLGELTIPGAITRGTVTVTQGSTTVLGTPLSSGAWYSDRALEGRFFQVDRIWYQIATLDPGLLHLTLTEPYAGPSNATATYRIVARTAALAEGCRTIVGFYHDRWNRELTRKSLPWLDLDAPERCYQLGGPALVADIGEDPLTRRRLVEFYPYSAEPEHLRYAYYAAPKPLALDEELPATIDQDALKEGVVIDVMRWKMARAADLGQTDIAALWRNEYRAQESKWQGVLRRLERADTVIEDLAWISRSMNGTWTASHTDVTTAREQVWAAGRRP